VVTDSTADGVVHTGVVEQFGHGPHGLVATGHLVGAGVVVLEVESTRRRIELAFREHVCEDDLRPRRLRYFDDGLRERLRAVVVVRSNCHEYRVECHCVF
jgi:transcriptional accessory protein Tex/SPT6